LLLRLARRVMAAKSRCWTLQPSQPTTTGYFLLAQRVITGDSFFEVCHEEYDVDLRRKLFRCDRQVTYILKGKGGFPRSQKIYVLKQVDNRCMELKNDDTRI